MTYSIDTITRKHCSGCDEWTMVPCRDCGHTARICCLKVEGSNWANKLILRSNDHPTDCDETNGEKDTCGSFALVASPCLDFKVQWTLAGGVSCKRVFVSITGQVPGDTNTLAGTQIAHSFFGGLDWYTTPISWIQGGVTYTVSLCEEGDEGLDYHVTANQILHALSSTPLETDPPTTQITSAYGTGNRLCGFALVCDDPTTEGDPTLVTTCTVASEGAGAFISCMGLQWTYDIQTDLVTVYSVSQTGGGSWAVTGTLFTISPTGEWIGDTIPLTLWSTTITGPPVTDVAVGRVSGCNDTDWDPLCDPGCWPRCLKCGTIPFLAMVIEEDPACCLSGTFDLYFNAGENRYQSWPVTDPPTSPGFGIGGPAGVCGLLNWLIVQCGSDSGHVTLQFHYTDVASNSYTKVHEVACTCEPAFETDYVHLPSTTSEPKLCESPGGGDSGGGGGGSFGSKLRIVAV